MTARVALATCAEWPELWLDDHPLVAALRARGVAGVPCIWDDPDVDWAGFPLVAVRSTWDYTTQRAAFLAWAERVAAVTTLANPLPVLRWNSHKGYLRDLAAAGVPVVPTVWASEVIDLAAVLDERGWSRAVVKPAVSAGGRDTVIVDRRDTAAGQELLAALVPRGEVMVQPYLDAVEAYGERSLLHIDGELTHTVRRPAYLLEGLFAESTVAEPAADELAVAQCTLAAVAAVVTPSPLLYARVDTVRDAQGVPHLIELEVVEPQLFLRLSESATARLADAVQARLP